MPLIQPQLQPNPPGISLNGKTAIVTGASAGIGLETCRQLLTLKITNLYMAVRNVSKGETVKEALLADSTVKAQNPKANVKVLKLDMESYESVKQFSKTLSAQTPTLDLLILNAGIGSTSFQTSTSGHEQTLQVNYLSNTLLVLSLLPLLIHTSETAKSPSRITWVGSRMHRRSSFLKRPNPTSSSVIDWVTDPKNFNMFTQYSDTKLLALLFMQDVAQRLPADKVLFNMFCPGMVYTNMVDNLPWLLRNLTHLVWSIRGRSAEQGAWMAVNAAVVAGKESHGEFMDDTTVVKLMNFLQQPAGRELRRRLWGETLAEISKYTNIPEYLAA